MTLEKLPRGELCDENSDEFGASHSAVLPDQRGNGAKRTTSSTHRESQARSTESYGVRARMREVVTDFIKKKNLRFSRTDGEGGGTEGQQDDE